MTVSYKDTIKSILAIEAGYAAHQVKVAELEASREEVKEQEAKAFQETIGGFQELCVDVAKHMGLFQKDAASDLTVPEQKWSHFVSFFGPKVKPESIRKPLKTWLVKLGKAPEVLAEILADTESNLESPEVIYKELNNRTRVEPSEDEKLAKLAFKFFEAGKEAGFDGGKLRAMLDVAAKAAEIDASYFEAATEEAATEEAAAQAA